MSSSSSQLSSTTTCNKVDHCQGILTPSSPLTSLYDAIETFDEGYLKVSDIHTIYYEVSGNKDGQPAIILHGGPGGGSVPFYRQSFDPKHYCIIQFDQRGCGKSSPSACLEQNTTWDLVNDIELLRNHLKIDKWVVFGGSWGSTLSLAYAVMHPYRCLALVLRGIFLLRYKELQWFYQEGASYLFPDHWQYYLDAIPESERHALIPAYYRRLTGNNEEEKIKCATAWSRWEKATSRLFVDPSLIKRAEEDGQSAITIARIESHYFNHAGFFPRDGWLLEDEQINKIKHIPTTIVQGRYDVVCPAYSAYDLHKKLSNADFYIINDAGHSAKEPGIISELVNATNKYRTIPKSS